MRTTTEENEKLKTLVKTLPQKRKSNKEKLIQAIAKKFILIQQQRKVLYFPREHLSVLFEDCHKRAKERYTTAIIKTLLKNKIVKEHEVCRASYSWSNCPLNTFDYGSYSLLMEKNGYKRNLVKYTKEQNRPPKKQIVKSLAIGESLPQEVEFDKTEIVSDKPRKKQACWESGNKSVYRHIVGYTTKLVYQIL